MNTEELHIALKENRRIILDVKEECFIASIYWGDEFLICEDLIALQNLLLKKNYIFDKK